MCWLGLACTRDAYIHRGEFYYVYDVDSETRHYATSLVFLIYYIYDCKKMLP